MDTSGAAATRFGVDIGGSGVKAAPVEVARGVLAAERRRIETPHPATPEALAGVLAELVAQFAWSGPVGVAFPAVVDRGVVRTAANVDDSWIGDDVEARFAEALGRPVHVLNDADAAGLAEMRYGAGRGHDGTVVMVTLGTGIGTAVFTEGVLVPNTELGHLELWGGPAEHRAAADARQRDDLSWKQWAKLLDEYLGYLERLLWPELIVLGGGVSKKSAKFVDHLHTRAEVVPAVLRNEAGIIGAAVAEQRL